ncbi:DUF4129 domain-containing protein [Budvicia diplopodorum]|uniref:DUF4129 domain-containing protein n=1 Tax=Budvicia diplopodorum TaxID=1119056 RepID=UPI00135ABE81|nr:DUF4129 domain-containing protein [Budvicia diplopodorum]
MQLEQLAIVLRPRRANEAIDLGVRIAINWFKPLYSAWLCFTLPIIAIIWGLLFWANASHFTILLAIWWMKPLFDRIALFVISRAVFGDVPTVMQSLKAARTSLLKTSIIRALTWARFSPYRSLTMPVDVLEGMKGKSAKMRRSAISGYIGINAIFLTLSGFIIEQVFPICAMAFMAMLSVDDTVNSNIFLDVLQGDAEYLYGFPIALYILGMLLWEPIYVAAGFSLYLKRRSDIEAWDIELQFRKMEKKRSALPSALLGMALVIFSFVSITPSNSYAAETDTSARGLAIQQSSETLNHILQQPEYGGEVVKERLKFADAPKEKKKEQPRKEQSKPSFNSNSQGPFNGIAGVSQIILWIGLALIICGIVYFVLMRLPVLEQKKKRSFTPPTEIAGLDIQPESLPQNIAEVALSLIHKGDLRAALSLLFRGTLSVLAHRDRVMFRSSDTEQDCIRLVKRADLSSTDFFIALTQLWLAQAYAHRSPDIIKLELLCREWPTHFDHQSQWEAS